MLHLFALLYVLAAPGADADAILTPAQIADKVAPALVSIRADTPAGESAGSGFIVDPLGTVVTSLHVVEGATAIRVKLASGLVYTSASGRATRARIWLSCSSTRSACPRFPSAIPTRCAPVTVSWS